MDEYEIRHLFIKLNDLYFKGLLKSKTKVESKELNGRYAGCKKDDSIIYIDLNWSSEMEIDLEGSLIHEMCHAFEVNFPDKIHETEEAKKFATALERPLMESIYEYHSPKFFTKLSEIMAKGGHEINKREDLDKYFG